MPKFRVNFLPRVDVIVRTVLNSLSCLRDGERETQEAQKRRIWVKGKINLLLNAFH